MPALNNKNIKYFRMAKCIREGKVSLPKKDLQLFVRCIKELTDPRFQGLADPIADLRYDISGTGAASSEKGPIEPMYLDEEGEDTNTEVDTNPTAKTFQQKGNFEQYIQKFSGLEFKPKELESVANYVSTKPTKQDKFSIRYEKSDNFNNNTITVIKKLREDNNLVFTAFQVSSPQSTGNTEQKPAEDNIMVNKSVSFRDEIEGGKILADLLQKLKI
jgi:hypothetical protein